MWKDDICRVGGFPCTSTSLQNSVDFRDKDEARVDGPSLTCVSGVSGSSAVPEGEKKKKNKNHRDLGSPSSPLKIQGTGLGDLWNGRERLFAFVDRERHDEVLSFLSCSITTFREPSYNRRGFFFFYFQKHPTDILVSWGLGSIDEILEAVPGVIRPSEPCSPDVGWRVEKLSLTRGSPFNAARSSLMPWQHTSYYPQAAEKPVVKLAWFGMFLLVMGEKKAVYSGRNLP